MPARLQTGRAAALPQLPPVPDQASGLSLLHRDEGPSCNFMQVHKVPLRLQRKKFYHHETGAMQRMVERRGRVSL